MKCIPYLDEPLSGMLPLGTGNLPNNLLTLTFIRSKGEAQNYQYISVGQHLKIQLKIFRPDLILVHQRNNPNLSCKTIFQWNPCT